MKKVTYNLKVVIELSDGDDPSIVGECLLQGAVEFVTASKKPVGTFIKWSHSSEGGGAVDVRPSKTQSTTARTVGKFSHSI